MPEFGENIDTATFEQILEMDDDEDEREFSKSIVYDFFLQAESTFQKMDSNLYVYFFVSHLPAPLFPYPCFASVKLLSFGPSPPNNPTPRGLLAKTLRTRNLN